MATANVSIRMDRDIKEQAEQLFADLGLNMTTAMNMFVKQALREQGIPFHVSARVPNAATIEAMKEAELIARDPNAPTYADAKSTFAAALAD